MKDFKPKEFPLIPAFGFIGMFAITMMLCYSNHSLKKENEILMVGLEKIIEECIDMHLQRLDSLQSDTVHFHMDIQPRLRVDTVYIPPYRYGIPDEKPKYKNASHAGIQ